MRNDRRRAGAEERVEYSVSWFGKQIYEPFRQGFREHSAVIFVAALRCEVEHIAGVYDFAADPVCDCFAEAAPYG